MIGNLKTFLYFGRMCRCFTLILWLLAGCQNTDTQPPREVAENLFSIKDIWQAYPARLHTLFGAIDRKIPELRPLDRFLNEGDTIEACRFLLDYYRNVDRHWVIATADSVVRSEAILRSIQLAADSVHLLGSTVQIPGNSAGGWQWSYTGIHPDDEFGYSLNGHRYLSGLLFAKSSPGDSKPVSTFDRIIKDWIVQHPLPEIEDSIYLVLDTASNLDWRDIGEVEWRTLETGNRLGASWCALFDAFQDDEDFSDAGRLLMLSSLVDQARYLKRYHKSIHNWTTMEMNGLALTGLAFPEFEEAEEWANYALGVMQDEIDRQVYPDGVQTEISTKTQWVALNRFESVAEHFEKAGRPLSSQYIQRLEEMYNYLAYCMRPDGHQPLNNDSDREDLRPRVLVAAEKFKRPDWEWVATNGQSGTNPIEDPSLVFPWGGISIMRNSWDQHAHWAFFDAGPYGTGHQHRDKLHLSVTAFGKDLLVDAGRFTHQDYFSFDPTIWRGYFRSSHSHNVILIDGQGQKAGPLLAAKPLHEQVDYVHHEAYDFFAGKFKDGYENTEGEVEHWRSVLYLKDKYWLVLDQVITDRPRHIQTLWHFAPSCQVSKEGTDVLSTNRDQPNLRIHPLTETPWQVEIVQGQEEPVIQGWYSADYGIKVPNPTAVFTAEINQSAVFAWILVPSSDVKVNIQATMKKTAQHVLLNIHSDNNDPINIRLPLDQSPRNLSVIF